jgi:hypothetical protein
MMAHHNTGGTYMRPHAHALFPSDPKGALGSTVYSNHNPGSGVQSNAHLPQSLLWHLGLIDTAGRMSIDGETVNFGIYRPDAFRVWRERDLATDKGTAREFRTISRSATADTAMGIFEYVPTLSGLTNECIELAPPYNGSRGDPGGNHDGSGGEHPSLRALGSVANTRPATPATINSDTLPEMVDTADIASIIPVPKPTIRSEGGSQESSVIEAEVETSVAHLEKASFDPLSDRGTIAPQIAMIVSPAEQPTTGI